MQKTQAGIHVSGIGKLKIEPNMAFLSFSINKGAFETAALALESTKTITKKALTILENLKIDKKNIQTTGLSIFQSLEWCQETRKNKFLGFEAVNTINLKILNLDILGNLFDSLASVGVTSINNPIFSHTEIRNYYDETRRLATKDAIAKAELYAKEARVGLGRLYDLKDEANLNYFESPKNALKCSSTFSSPCHDNEMVQVGEIEIISQISSSFYII